MRLLVFGGRTFADSRMLASALDRIHAANEITFLIQGGQRRWCAESVRWIGADWLASEWARWREVPFVNEPARWARDGGRVAGPLRNSRMLEKWLPEKGLEFPGGSGTADMRRKLIAAGVEVLEAANV